MAIKVKSWLDLIHILAKQHLMYKRLYLFITALIFIFQCVENEVYAIKPDLVYRAKPSDYGIKFQEHRIPVGTNEFVLSWELPRSIAPRQRLLP